jgi:DNA-binding PadR family transcriptional regulator
MTGLERKAVQEALRRLREEGVIVPIEHFEGGRGNAVTYKLVALGQEQAATAPQEAKVGQIRTALARIMAENPKLTYGEARTLAEKAA